MRMFLPFFLLPIILAWPLHAQELTPEKVAEIWPYSETILKVKAGKKDLVKEEKKLRLAKVIAQSTEDGICTAYDSMFEFTDLGWTFDSTTREYEVSCGSFRAKKGTNQNRPGSPVLSEKEIKSRE